MTIKFKKLSEDAIIPQYQTKGAAGFDIHALTEQDIAVILAGETKLIKTGLSVEIPEGYELQIRSRSSYALKSGIIVLNAPGTIDADYRGEIGIILHNTSAFNFGFKKGDRIAQGVIAKVEQPNIEVVEELSSTDRGAGGFGSTGK